MPCLRCCIFSFKKRSKRANQTNPKASIPKSKFEKNVSDGSKSEENYPYKSIASTQYHLSVNNDNDINNNFNGISNSRDVKLLKNKKGMKLFRFLNKEDNAPSHTNPIDSMDISDEGTNDGTVETEKITNSTHSSNLTSPSLTRQLHYVDMFSDGHHESLLSDMSTDGDGSNTSLLFKDDNINSTPQIEEFKDEPLLHLKRRAASTEDNYHVVLPTPSPSSPTSRPTLKMRSILDSVPQDDLIFSTSTKDTSVSLRPTSNLSLEMTSFLDPVPQEELLTPATPHTFPLNLIQTKTRDQTKPLAGKTYRPIGSFNLVPLESNKDLSLEDILSVSHLPADLSMDTESILSELHVMPEEDEKFRRSMDDHPDLPHDTNDLGQQNVISRPRTSSRSSSEETGQVIRPGITDEMMSDINCELDPKNTFSILGSSTNSMSNQHIDNTAIENKSHANTPELDDINTVIRKDGSSYNKSTRMTTSSYAYMKELSSNVFGSKEDKGQCAPYSSYSDLSMPGVFEDSDSNSCHSCVVSFDSMEFPEDEQFDHNANSTTSCSISIHDLATACKDNEYDIVDNNKIQMGWNETNQECQSLIFNKELDGRILQLSSQGTTDSGTLSSITNDSYLSERGNSPGQSGRKKYQDTVNININDHDDYVNEVQPILQQPLNNEPSQFMLEASQVTSVDSVCSHDSFSSKSLKYMLDILKEEKERRSINIPVELRKYMLHTLKEETDRRRSKIKKQIAKMETTF